MKIFGYEYTALEVVYLFVCAVFIMFLVIKLVVSLL